MTTYTTSLRLWEGTPGDPAIRNAWGPPLNTNQVLLESAITDTVAVSINGLTSYTLSTANGAADQARPLVQSYTGALTGTCTVTLPNVPKFGWAQNSTTGGHNVVLTAGAGTTVTIPPDGRLYWYWADGATNVSLPTVGFGGLGFSGNVAITGTLSAGATTLSGALTVSSGGAAITGNSTVTGTLGATGLLTASGGITVSGSPSTISNALRVNGGLSTDSATTTFGGSASVPVGQELKAATGSGSLQFTSNGVFLSMSNSGTALFDFQDSTQQFAWGYGATSPMVLAGASGNLTITGVLTQGSDRRIKHRIRRIRPEAGAAWARTTAPVEYELGGRATAGFIAQDEIAIGFDRGVHLTPNPKMRATKDSPAGRQYVMDLESRVAYLTAAVQYLLTREPERKRRCRSAR